MNYFYGTSEEPKKLQVRVGPSVESLQVTSVNSEEDPHFIDSPYFIGQILVRIKDFKGVGYDAQTEKSTEMYFGEKKRLFALQLQGRFKHEYSIDDIVFGCEFDKKVSPPTGTWVAMKFATMIDPALISDAYAETPYFFSPLICAMNTAYLKKAEHPVANAAPSVIMTYNPNSLKKGGEEKDKKKNEDEAGLSSVKSINGELDVKSMNGPDPKYKPADNEFISISSSKANPDTIKSIGNWPWKNGAEMSEESGLLVENPPFPSNCSSERRKHFQKTKTRVNARYNPSIIYGFEIYAPFIDMNTMDLSLGININIIPYMNNQPLRMMAKSKTSGRKLFVVEFDMVN